MGLQEHMDDLLSKLRPNVKAARSRAETAIDSGAAARKLEQLAAGSHGTPAEERE